MVQEVVEEKKMAEVGKVPKEEVKEKKERGKAGGKGEEKERGVRGGGGGPQVRVEVPRSVGEASSLALFFSFQLQGGATLL